MVLMAELFDYQNRVRVQETLTCEQFIPRVRELEARGGAFWIIKVLNHNKGYTIQCDLPGPGTPELFHTPKPNS
jgi:hypothetical protein